MYLRKHFALTEVRAQSWYNVCSFELVTSQPDFQNQFDDAILYQKCGNDPPPRTRNFLKEHHVHTKKK